MWSACGISCNTDQIQLLAARVSIIYGHVGMSECILKCTGLDMWGILNINWRIGFGVELLVFAYYGGGF